VFEIILTNYERPMVTFQLNEFPILSSRIHNFTFSTYGIYEFTVSAFQLREFTISNSCVLPSNQEENKPVMPFWCAFTCLRQRKPSYVNMSIGYLHDVKIL
jgi:hypothetical protein